MLQHCILTSLFFRLQGRQAKYFWLAEKLDIYGLLAAKCCLNSVFAIWSKLAQTQFTKDSGGMNTSSAPSDDFQFAETQRNATLQFTTYMATFKLAIRKTLLPLHKVKKSSHFVLWPLRSLSQRMGRRSDDNKESTQNVKLSDHSIQRPLSYQICCQGPTFSSLQQSEV